MIPYITNLPRPKMLFLTADYTGHIVESNMETMVGRIRSWLSYHFDVTILTGTVNLARETDRHRPDIILFDGMIEALHELRPHIEDLNLDRSVPRAGLFVVDSLSPTRAIIADYLDSLGAEMFFVLGDTTMGESFEDLKSRIIYVPQFIDPAIFRDYGLYKSIPVLLGGNWDAKQYPWRSAIREELLNRFPTLYFRHPGYDPKKQWDTPVRAFGESFSKLINSSRIVPTSGGFKNIAISKHIEIPASRACLVTDPSPGVSLMGFVHMENAVFATAKEAPDVIEHLLRNPDECQRITDAGYHFAHERHSLGARTQIREWLSLRRDLPSSMKIVQPDPLGRLERITQNSSITTFHQTGAEDAAIIASADAAILQDDLDDALFLCDEALSLCCYLAEPWLRKAIVYMLKGNADKASNELGHAHDWRNTFGATNQDPVELSILLMALLGTAKFDLAMQLADALAAVKRPELVRARWATYAALGQIERLFELSAEERSCHPKARSIHKLPEISAHRQMEIYSLMLQRCGVPQLSRNLTLASERYLEPTLRASPYDQSAVIRS